MDANGGTITWFLTANDADFNAAMLRSRVVARQTGRSVDRDLSKGLKNAQLSLDDFSRDLHRSATLFRDFQVALRGFQMTSLILGVTLAGGAIIELVAALTTATQSVIALPGIIAPAIGAFSVLKVATLGVGDALKSVTKGDIDKLAEQMAKLSPAAQEFVRSFAGISQAFEPVKIAVQQAFFEGLGKQMEAVAAKSLPLLKVGMVDVADSMNGLVKEAARVAQEPFFQGIVAETLKSTAKSTDTLTGAVEPLTQALAGLVKIGLPFSEMLSQWVVDLSKSAALYINSAEGQKALTDAINLGIDALQKLGDLIGSIFKLFVALFKVSNEEGLSLVDTLIKIIDQMTAWVNSAQGQELLTALFQATNDVLIELAQALGDVIVFVLQIVKAFNDLPQPLKDIVTHMIVMSAVTGPLISYISSLAASFSLLRFGVREVFQFFKAGAGIPQMIVFARNGKQALFDLQSGFNDARAAASAFTGTAGTIGGGLRAGLDGIKAAATGLAGFFSAAASSGGVLGTVLSGIATAARVAWAAITGPVGIVILVITALVAAFVWLYNNVKPVRDFMDGMWKVIVDSAKAAGEWFAGPFAGFFVDAWDSIMKGAQVVGKFFSDLWDGIVKAVAPVVDALTSIANVVGQILVGAFNAFVGVVKTVIAILQPLWDILSLIGAIFAGIAQIIFNVVVQAFTVIWTILSTIAQIIGVIVVGSLMKLGELFTWVFNNAAAVVQTAFTIIQTVFTTVWNAIVAFFTPIVTAIGQVVSTVFNTIASVVTTVFTNISNFIKTIWNGIMTFLQPILNVIASIFSTVFNAVAATVNRVFNLIKQYIINPISAVVNYVGQTVGKIATFIGNAVTNAYNAVAGFVSKFTSAGKNIIDGIVQGLKNGGDAVVNFVKNVCSNALNAVKNFFGIKSPSKVMAQMGGFIMQGFGNGIEKQQDAVVGAAQSAAEGVMDAFSGMQTSIGSMQSDFNVNGNASGTIGVDTSSLPPAAVDGTTDSTVSRAVVVEQTNNVYTDLDMDQVNRNLTWELNKL